MMSSSKFLPTNRKEMLSRGWQSVDVILVTGDAYVDHPSFGISLIGRWLEFNGYRVAVLAQPPYHDNHAFKEFGKPNLFFGITAGNLDSIVANYTGNAKVRDRDNYSPDGNPYYSNTKYKSQRRRPDRATIIYSNLAKSAYSNCKIILGGIEASLRRFTHFDYKQNKIRGSVLTDSKADLLVYGMGERSILKIADRIKKNKLLNDIPGTCERLTVNSLSHRLYKHNCIELPSWQDIQKDNKHFIRAELAIDKNARSGSSEPVIQKQQNLWIIQHRAATPLTTQELDTIYALPFKRIPHPSSGKIPAYRTIRHSVTIVRGCYGNCSFCSITRHQGPIITNRSHNSIIKEVENITKNEDFRGTISDLGGPTANMYGTSCHKSTCKRRDCLFPKVCSNLQINEKAFQTLLLEISKLKGIKHLFISSGLRMELLLKTPFLLEAILKQHTPGALKIAPEHTEKNVLRLMHKQPPDILPKFIKLCIKIGKKCNIDVAFTPYLLTSHPGCTKNDMHNLAKKIADMQLQVRQFQDFTPTPGTLSTAMYVSDLDRDTLNPIVTPKKASERRSQRTILEKIQSKF